MHPQYGGTTIICCSNGWCSNMLPPHRGNSWRLHHRRNWATQTATPALSKSRWRRTAHPAPWESNRFSLWELLCYSAPWNVFKTLMSIKQSIHNLHSLQSSCQVWGMEFTLTTTYQFILSKAIWTQFWDKGTPVSVPTTSSPPALLSAVNYHELLWWNINTKAWKGGKKRQHWSFLGRTRVELSCCIFPCHKQSAPPAGIPRWATTASSRRLFHFSEMSLEMRSNYPWTGSGLWCFNPKCWDIDFICIYLLWNWWHLRKQLHRVMSVPRPTICFNGRF